MAFSVEISLKQISTEDLAAELIRRNATVVFKNKIFAQGATKGKVFVHSFGDPVTETEKATLYEKIKEKVIAANLSLKKYNEVRVSLGKSQIAKVNSVKTLKSALETFDEDLKAKK